MNCPKFGSDNIKVQVINEVHMKNVHRGCSWWLMIKWLVFTIQALLFKIFGHKKKKQ